MASDKYQISVTLNDLQRRRNGRYFPYSVALEANYIKVVEEEVVFSKSLPNTICGSNVAKRI